MLRTIVLICCRCSEERFGWREGGRGEDDNKKVMKKDVGEIDSDDDNDVEPYSSISCARNCLYSCCSLVLWINVLFKRHIYSMLIQMTTMLSSHAVMCLSLI